MTDYLYEAYKRDGHTGYTITAERLDKHAEKIKQLEERITQLETLFNKVFT